MTLSVQDWRDLPAALMRPLLGAEQQRWYVDLGWDVRAAWANVEPCRLAGLLPGLVARDGEGAIQGWTFFAEHRGVLQVVSLRASGAATAAALIAGIKDAAAARGSRPVIAFLFDQSHWLAATLGDASFATEIYRYRALDLVAAPERGPGRLRHWQAGDLTAVAAVCANAYAASLPLRPFAIGGAPEDWQDYVQQLAERHACGPFLSGASFIAMDEASERVAGAVITTQLSTGVAHIAQVVVSPEARGRGLGRELVTAALDAARGSGCARMTLLVASTNVAANALYERLGFVEKATFLAAIAGKQQPAERFNT